MTPPDSARASDAYLESVMARVAGGDRDAFSDLYDATSGHLFAVIQKVLRNQALSEEVLQDAYVQIWQQAASYQAGRGRVITWCLTLAHRRAVDRVRSVRASRERDLTQGAKEYQESYDDVEDTVAIRLEAERVDRAMAELNAGQAAAIKLAYYGGYTQQEIARIMDLPLGTVKTRIRDGMSRLRTTLGVRT
ncbi:RNA polymerase sigma factor SigK [Tersicoccus solisilvae]|uniref:RNA polymerase sigma factor SigK n=2 Tax=Tersicoccus solisilvae TaxID=1882339 RepID=A0ABQ1NLC0_9MICC|nr:RNA polymerase sigma factor SigK [Tersicoccus solisilvae]